MLRSELLNHCYCSGLECILNHFTVMTRCKPYSDIVSPSRQPSFTVTTTTAMPCNLLHETTDPQRSGNEQARVATMHCLCRRSPVSHSEGRRRVQWRLSASLSPHSLPLYTCIHWRVIAPTLGVFRRRSDHGGICGRGLFLEAMLLRAYCSTIASMLSGDPAEG
ncbi:hypothetical protein K458DRAFT_138251 [Lentithecium fluviatile CBS 122367]|uniref:Uncharacterized protein n=1 Tax=Lentithecium fluviatile CBS 122367 TaxID=1168545 RepID=A0A6G1IK79_9PLEO|nr:hypothetical protein K458DRAFT_138251 [Lentithecium fluviatile CBS 122367]